MINTDFFFTFISSSLYPFWTIFTAIFVNIVYKIGLPVNRHNTLNFINFTDPKTTTLRCSTETVRGFFTANLDLRVRLVIRDYQVAPNAILHFMVHPCFEDCEQWRTYGWRHSPCCCPQYTCISLCPSSSRSLSSAWKQKERMVFGTSVDCGRSCFV